MTLMILIFGELIPKTLALSNADKFALKIAPIIRIIILAFYPLTKILNFIVGFILKLMELTIKDSSKRRNTKKRRRIKGSHRSSWEGFNWEKKEKQMLKSILDLDEITVRSIMVSRNDIFSLSSDVTYSELLSQLKDSPHSRIPVWKKILKTLWVFFT